MTAVSTQTSLSCPGYDNLLPQTLLFNLVTAKVGEAFQLATVHAQASHYKDNLALVKKEDAVFPHYRPRPSLRLDDAHLDLVFPSTQQDCFSPEHYKPPKRQRLNSLPQHSFKTIERPPEKISFNKTMGLLKKDECSICVEGFENKVQLKEHLKACPKFLPHTTEKAPVSKPDVCRSLNWEISETVPSQVPNLEKTSSSSSENIEIKKVKPLKVKHKSSEKEGSELEEKSEGSKASNVTQPAEIKPDGIKSDRTKPARTKATNIDKTEETKLGHPVTSDNVNKRTEGKSPATSEEGPQKNKRRRVQSRKARESKCTEEDLRVEDVGPVKRKKVSVKVNVKKKASVPKMSTFQCSQCNCNFTSRWTMKRHEYTIHGIGTPLTSDDVGNRQYGTECLDCIESQTDSASAQDVCNNMSHDIKEDLPSPGKLNTILQNLCAQTMSTNIDSEWLCGICGLRFKSRILLKRHGKSHRNKTEIPDVGQDGMFMCYICFGKLPSFRKLLNHQAKHAYRPKCGVCHKTFPLISMLKNHKCVKELVQVNCRHCSLTFHSAIEAKRHMSADHAKLQNAMSSTVCRLCDYTFSSSTKYLVHKSISHPTPEFLCFICDKLYGDRKGLEQHCTCFHNTKPYICTVCEDGFDVLGNLQGHKSAQHFGASK